MPVNNWLEHHELKAEFHRLTGSGEIALDRTVNYGHPHFHGHSGRVDIYLPV